MNFATIKTKLKSFGTFVFPGLKRENLEDQYNYDICKMLEKKPKNIEEVNFKNYGWGYIVYTSYNITENGRNYSLPFYIVTKDKKFIFNDKDLSLKVSSKFISETYFKLKEYFKKELKEESR